MCLSVASAMNEGLYKAVMDELVVLLSDSDLHISQLVLTLLGTIMDISPASIKEVCVQLSHSHTSYLHTVTRL